MTKTTYTLENGVLLPRRRLLTSVLGLGAASLGFPALALSKPLKGITLNTSLFTTAYSKLLRPWISEFEEATGATINFDTPSFAVYNQRTDLELSTHGASLDAVNVTFIYSSRWINSGWLQPLDDFISAPQLTPTDYDINDFLPGALAPERGSDGKLYGIPWTAETTLTAASRFDVLREQGLSFPDTTDALLQAAQQLNRKERASGFVTDNHYGWSFPPFLHAFGGDIFRNAPHDLYPTLDTPEAIAAADYFAHLLREFGPDGVVSFTPDQSLQSLKAGRSHLGVQGQIYLSQLADRTSSKVAGTAAWGLIPKGPAGRFPGVAVHGWGIPVGSKNKEAAWQFIRWATSKATLQRAVAAGYGSPTRRSDIASQAYAQRQRANGFDIGKLVSQSIDLAGRQGHMKYRTVAVYPQVDQQINKAIELIATGQRTAEQAMKQAQIASIAELKRAGIKL
ncbi:ABC transporter substrate-binding protein [Comamonas sp. NoAH]|uniref:ABC transporter substrate-binding protein n=1 Tax=Comamonas halotolerans TaxID=3041496 RepID=UPI0024E0B25C|nr:extracellular solute-binding protein [Comamonas sp. NoAH]